MNTKKTEFKEERVYDIILGPTTSELFYVFKNACDQSKKFDIFTVAIGQALPKSSSGPTYIVIKTSDFRILKLEHKNCSNESFNLEGYCKADLNSFGATKVVYTTYKFKAYYDSSPKKRCGHIVFEH